MSRLACLVVCVLALPAASLAAEVKPRPNILLILGDNWSWPHASAYGEKVVKTPTFDALAREGALFTHAFAPFPSCTPSRASLLTGQVSHRLKEGANLWSTLPKSFAVYPDLLESAGYVVGFTGKGWAPGPVDKSERTRNPAGPEFKSFEAFLETVTADKPFCFWFGSREPHLPWTQGVEFRAAMKSEDVTVPAYLPDHSKVRQDIVAYYAEIQQLDQDAGRLIEQLRLRNLLDNTIVIMTSDNGWQMPRGLANVYDSGTHIPLAIRWGKQIKAGRCFGEFVSLTDLAPTFLEAAGLKPPAEMTAQSLLSLLRGDSQPGRDLVFLERERHANVRVGDGAYPCRAVRTRDFLYIRNLRPERWPAGDPQLHFAVAPYGDIDPTPTKELIQSNAALPEFAPFFVLAFAKRPAEELYDLRKDPGQIKNVADRMEYAEAKKQLRARLDQWMKETADPRADSDDDRWDKYPYYGPPAKKKP